MDSNRLAWMDSAVVRVPRMACAILVIALFTLGLNGSSAFAGTKRKPSVLLVHAEPNAFWMTDVQSIINSSGQFASVALFDARAASPTLAQLLPYDAVLLSCDAAFGNPVTLGNSLADYVDAGGGVVNMAFSTTNYSFPTGRWSPGYLSMVAGGAIAQGTAASLDLASITNQNHPILIGVTSFSGGSASFRANQNNVVSGATIVARWTGGNVLASTGPLPGRADLNFFPVSNSQRSDFWDQSTDGIKLIVNSLLYVMRPRVLLVHADFQNSAFDVQAKLKGTGTLGIVDIFDATVATPTLTQLRQYDAVLTWSFNNYNNAVALGNVLADFVDAGGGVVTSMVANAESLTTRRLGGRWIVGGYEIISGGSGVTGGSAGFGAVAYPNHPIVTGATGFFGGGASYRPVATTVNSGGLVIARWSDGRILVATSSKFANRADLGMYAVSGSISPSFWQVGTGGDKLMANALLYTVKPYVACVTSDLDYVADPVAKLQASRRFSGVASLDAQNTTPSAVALAPFGAVMTWSDLPYNNSNLVGNTLADFVDAGGGVVTTAFGNFLLNPNYAPGGRWVTQGYEIVPSPLPAYTFNSPASLGAVIEPLNPLAWFVRKFDGGSRSFRLTSNPPLRGRTIIKWSDGGMFASVHNSRKRADLGFYPGSSGILSGGWNQRTDGTWLMGNALEYVVRAKPCRGDLNGDGQVDDTDFVLFAGYYDALVDPRGDFNGDGLTEDGDFVAFAGAYDALVCP